MLIFVKPAWQNILPGLSLVHTIAGLHYDEKHHHYFVPVITAWDFKCPGFNFAVAGP